jgi:DnaD/phage-associated family protein
MIRSGNVNSVRFFLKENPKSLVKSALDISESIHGNAKMDYVAAILRNWKKNGKKPTN